MSDWKTRKARGYPIREDWQEGRCLGPAELAALNDGDAISVIWGGGNGPHTYTAKRWHDRILAAAPSIPEGAEDILYSPDTPELFAMLAWVERAEHRHV